VQNSQFLTVWHKFFKPHVHNGTRKIGYAAHEHMKKDVFVHNNYQNYKNFPALRAGLN